MDPRLPGVVGLGYAEAAVGGQVDDYSGELVALLKIVLLDLTIVYEQYAPTRCRSRHPSRRPQNLIRLINQ